MSELTGPGGSVDGQVVGHWGVSERAPRQPFAEIVREVLQTPAKPEPRTGGITDPSGTYWRPDTQISPTEALALAAGGASVAWDECGCGGYCGFRWFSTDEVTWLVAAGAPTVRRTKRRRGNLSRWAGDDSPLLVVAEDAVRWGDLLDG